MRARIFINRRSMEQKDFLVSWMISKLPSFYVKLSQNIDQRRHNMVLGSVGTFLSLVDTY